MIPQTLCVVMLPLLLFVEIINWQCRWSLFD